MCSIFLIKLQRQKTAAFAAMYQLKRVTVAILNCALFHSFAALWTETLNLLNGAFIGILKCFAVLKVTTRVRMLSVIIDTGRRYQSSGTDTGPQSFCHSFIALSKITLFEVSSKIHCSGVSSRYCCYLNLTASSKPIYKLLSIWIENCIVSLCRK